MYYAMANTLYSISQCKIKNYLICFEALIKPILLYGCELWATKLLENRKPIKFLSGQNYLLAAEKLLKFLLGVTGGGGPLMLEYGVSYLMYLLE